LRERITTDCRNTPSTTNPEDEEIEDAPGNDGNASMPEQVKRPNPWRKKMMVIFYAASTCFGLLSPHLQGADTKIYLKYRGIKYVTVSVQVLCYQHL